MTTETQVAPDAATQNQASEPAQATEVVNPEVAAPETAEQTEQETAESRAEKAAKALERRLNKRTADYHRERAERERLAQELEAARGQGKEPEQDDPRATALQLAREIAAQERFTEKVSGVLSNGKKLEGFDAACNALNDEVPFYDDKGRPTPFLAAVMEGDTPHVVLHHLGTNPDLAAELAGLTPTQVARRLDRIERELAAKPKTSTAPKPLSPVKPTSVPSGPRDEDDVDTWMAKERARMAARGL